MTESQLQAEALKLYPPRIVGDTTKWDANEEPRRAFIRGARLSSIKEVERVAGEAIDYMREFFKTHPETGKPEYWLEDWEEMKGAYLSQFKSPENKK